jgi:excinuclease ABC subunit C
MRQLLSQRNFLDFGPAALFVPKLSLGTSGPLQQVHGQRPAQLRRALREQCQRRPGVYGMLDLHGELIYVGKAKNLRARLLTYFRPRSRDGKATRMVNQVQGIVWEIWPDEFAALHRELELIRRWRPRSNVQGKPHSWQHTYVCLGRAPAAYAFLARRPPTSSVLTCFGPILAGRRAREAVRRLNDWFRLRDCPQKQQMIFADEPELFAVERSPGCLRLELGTCLGPCAAACSRLDYTAQVQAARQFLAGADRAPLVLLERQMQQAAAAEQYERASLLRDKFAAFSWLHRQLDQLREAQAMEPMVYSVLGHDGLWRWYLLHCGRAVTAALAPADLDGVAGLLRKWEALRPSSTYGAEHRAGVLLLAAWFRRHPQERARVVALASVQQAAGPQFTSSPR